MRYSRTWLPLLLLFIGTATLFAQTGFGEDHATIFDELDTPGIGKGTVVIKQPLRIRSMVGTRLSAADMETLENDSYLKIQGYRVQVFSGNNQRNSKNEVFRKEKEVKDAFPDLSTYVNYVAPFWKLRVGDFRTHEEAYLMLKRLAQTFPSYGKEMYLVREEVKIPLY